jgi:hypothetical protein
MSPEEMIFTFKQKSEESFKEAWSRIYDSHGNGQITLGRSLLKLMGAVIDVGKGTMKFTSAPGNHHDFSKGKSKGKRGRRKASGLNASSFENT